MSDKKNLTFDKDVLFGKVHSHVKGYREELFRKFARNMTSLLESQKPKKYQTNRGLLDPRKLYRYQMDDNVFYKKTSVPKSDTTFVFLIDASGSMCGSTSIEYNDITLDRIEVCGAIVSAFAKANKAVLGNKIKMEVFTKSEGGQVFNSFVKGYVPILSRVFSNVKNDTDWDKLLGLQTSAPLKVGGRSVGSYTPEFLLLPALMEWAKKNLTTRNMVVINLTDGEVVHSFVPKESIGSYEEGTYMRTYRAYDEDTKSLRIKYLRGVPNTTLFLSSGYRTRDYETDHIRDIYGSNAINASADSFDVEMFKTLNTLLNNYA
tara:strand:- start:5094 stop:6050 length:957 start_codon:yes stop_codon:yes gene_type:complete